MTQPDSWQSTIDPQMKEWHWMRLRGQTVYREEAMAQAMNAYNEVTRAVAAEQKVDLYDAAKSLPKSLEYFFDDVHYTDKGSRELALGLAALITERLR